MDDVPVPVNVRRIRIMFSDGETVDYLTVDNGSSTLRGFALEQHYGRKSTHANASKHPEDRIEGVADLGVVYTYTPEVPDDAGTTPSPDPPVHSAPRSRRGVAQAGDPD